MRARLVVPASAQPQCPVRTPRCHTRASWKSFRRPPPALAMSARISDATRHRAAVNLITPVNAPVIDPTIDQVNFPRRISVADRAAAATVGAKALCHSVHAIRARHIVEPVQTLATSSRSEEHTSELQSRENLVCRLLLEKKN